LDAPVPEPLQNPGDYPRTYRAAGFWRVFLIIAALLSIGFGVGCAWAAAGEHPPPWLVPIALAFALAGVYCLASTTRTELVLLPDRIELRGLTGTKIMRRDEIRGWRRIQSAPPGRVLANSNPAGHTLRFRETFPLDPAYRSWLYRLPSLDSEAAQESKSEIRSNPALGATPGERMQALAPARRIARVLNIVASIICMWSFLSPAASSIAAASLVLLPWFAIVAVKDANGLLRFVRTRRGDAYPDLTPAGILPGIAIFALAATRYNVIFSSGAWCLTLAAAAAMIAALIWADSSLRTRRGALALMACVSLAWSYGAIIEVNGLFDMTPGVVSTALVQSKHTSGRRSRTYELTLAPWGPKDRPNSLTVSRATWSAIRPSDIVYLDLKPGALGVRWYRLQRWERGRRP
jgi:hypothetical protein